MIQDSNGVATKRWTKAQKKQLIHIQHYVISTFPEIGSMFSLRGIIVAFRRIT